MPSNLPLSTTTLYLQANGTYTSVSTGAAGETAKQVAITDLVCVDDLDPNGGETTSDLQAAIQDWYHVLIQAPNANLDQPGAGIGLDGALSGSAADVQRFPAMIDNWFRTDTRVANCTTTLTGLGDTWNLIIVIQPSGALLPSGGLVTFSANRSGVTLL